MSNIIHQLNLKYIKLLFRKIQIYLAISKYFIKNVKDQMKFCLTILSNSIHGMIYRSGSELYRTDLKIPTILNQALKLESVTYNV